jgi:hypothetical protein
MTRDCKERKMPLDKSVRLHDVFVSQSTVRRSDDAECTQVVHVCDACGDGASDFLCVYVGRVFTVAGIIAISPTAGDFLLAIVGFVHLALFGGVFCGISVLVSRACAGASGRVRLGAAAIIGIALGVVTLQPWYGIGSGFHSLYCLVLHH